MGLQVHSSGPDNLCVECHRAPAVGPCAACQAMICPDCCTMSSDPGGKRVICLSCARMIVDVGKRPLRRRTTSAKATAYMILAVLLVGLLAVLVHRF